LGEKIRRLMGLGEIPYPSAFDNQNRQERTGILSSHLLRVLDNLLANLGKVVELLTGKMKELSPLVRVVLILLLFRLVLSIRL
jgi:hypothetical protein